MASVGNIEANKKLENSLPVCWRRPKPTDPQCYIDQFIRAKYERKEFLQENKDKQKYRKGKWFYDNKHLSS